MVYCILVYSSVCYILEMEQKEYSGDVSPENMADNIGTIKSIKIGNIPFNASNKDGCSSPLGPVCPLPFGDCALGLLVVLLCLMNGSAPPFPYDWNVNPFLQM